MNQTIAIALINNAAMLLVLSAVYEVSYLIPSRYHRFRPYVNGLLITFICITVMSMPFRLQPGVVFDTRSIVISVTALTFGFIPTAMTMVTAAIFRIIMGGSGTLPGLAVILTSALIGLAWRYWVNPKSGNCRWLYTYAMSIAVHATMLLCMLLLPYPDSLAVIREIALPVMLIHPLASLLLSLLLLRQQERRHSLNASEVRYRRLFETAKDGILILGIETGRVLDANPSIMEMLGYTREQLLDKPIWDIDALQYIIDNRDDFTALKQKEYLRYEDVLLQTADGERIYVEFASNMYLVNSKKVLQCNIRDITDRKRSEDALLESEKKYSSYIENAPYGVFVVNENGKYVEVNKAATAITGYSKEELLQMDIKDITDEASLEAAMYHFKLLLEKGSMSTVLRYKHKDGSKRWWTIDAVKLSENRFFGFSGDITDRKKAEEDLVYLIYHDHLTGLYNRKYFEESKLQFDVEQYLPLSILIADINGVRLINDALGHAEGDKLIIETSRILESCCRQGDVLARVGGDEFGLLLLNTDAESAYKILKSIEKACEAHNENNGTKLYEINLSMGYDTKVTMKESIEEAAKKADENLRNQKLLSSKSFRSDLISSIMAAVYEKSQETEEHAKRLAIISKKTGEKLKLSQKSLGELELLSVLHDIGKVAIDGRILNKPGRLTDEEWTIMKTHPEIGYRIAKSTLELEPIAEYILTHHERWDGMGYPQGLKGEEIPLLSRIIAVVDSYDAMTNDRIYRKAMTMEAAMVELRMNAGTQYDPQIVQIFEDIIKELEFLLINGEGDQ